MKKYGPKLNLMFSLFALLLPTTSFSSPITARAEADFAMYTEGETLKVAFPNSPGFTSLSSQGERQGIVIDFLDEISKYTGWEYEFIATDNIMVDALNGTFDLIGGQFYDAALEEYFEYPEYDCGFIRMALIARKSDATIESSRLSSINGKKIGYYSNAIENKRRLDIYLETHDLNCQLVEIDVNTISSDKDFYAYLEDGRVDLLMDSVAPKDGNFYNVTSFDGRPHYIVTTTDKLVLDQTTVSRSQGIREDLNFALKQIYDANPNFATMKRDENFDTIKIGISGLSAADLAYIEHKKSVKVAVPKRWHPLFCKNDTSFHDGIIPTFLEEITAISGLNFEFVEFNSYIDAVRSVSNGEVEMLGFYYGATTRANEYNLALSYPFASLPMIVKMNKRVTYPSDNLVAGVLEGNYLPSEVHAKEVIYYKDTQSCLKDLDKGKIDIVIGMAYHIEEVLREDTYLNIVTAAILDTNYDISFATLKPVDANLFSILNKGLYSISDDRKGEIINESLITIPSSKVSLKSFFYENPYLIVLGMVIFFILVIGVLLVYFHYRSVSIKAKTQLEHANELNESKSEFLSRMSHEIRTPMNAIFGLADLTENMDDLPEKAKENINKIQAASRHLLGLINDILDMSKIEKNKMTLEVYPFYINELMNEINDMISVQAELRKIHFKIECDIDEKIVIGDQIRLRQVLLNLLSNALKFTEKEGHILLKVEQLAIGKNEVTYQFSVTDDGIGISKEDQKKVFEYFEQAENKPASSQGTGLGLAISKKITSLMDSELYLESDIGKGSKFYFTVTLPLSQEVVLKIHREYDLDILKNKKALLVEDNQINAEITKEMLEGVGVSVDIANNGKEALEYFEDECNKYDFILMDIMMPMMNGYDATRHIRLSNRSDANTVPIIAMSANTFKEDKEKAMEVGMNDFIAKPVEADVLYGTIATNLKKTK